jgi:hypothetical protein
LVLRSFSAHTVASELASSRLALLDVAGIPIPRQWFAVSRSDRAMTPVMEAFDAFLTQKAARHLPLVPQLYVESSSWPVDRRSLVTNGQITSARFAGALRF